MISNALSIAVLCLAAIPALLFVWNLLLVRIPVRREPTQLSSAPLAVSVLIPARNEAMRIRAALQSVLANRGVQLELIVLDDDSTDNTAAVVQQFAKLDNRVQLISTPALPPGWCGKQHACHELAKHAKHPLLVFMDADVRLTSDALERMAEFMDTTGAALASGVPRQQTVSFLEQLLIPLVHFVMLGFLPVWRMRRCTKPAYAAGCGQLFTCKAAIYHQVGGHAAIRDTLHDGIRLPRLFRRQGFRTDLFDATGLAECRMYEGAREVLDGLAKNAHEGLASPGLIVPMTLLLIGGQVLPWALLVYGLVFSNETLVLLSVAAALTLLPRLLAAWMFRQSLLGALLHPLGISILVAIQWWAFLRRLGGHSTSWRGRHYGGSSSDAPVKTPSNRAVTELPA